MKKKICNLIDYVVTTSLSGIWLVCLLTNNGWDTDLNHTLKIVFILTTVMLAWRISIEEAKF